MFTQILKTVTQPLSNPVNLFNTAKSGGAL